MGMSDYMAWLRERVGKELLLVPAVVASVVDEDGRVLLLERGDGEGMWGFPGVAMEPGESAVEAMRREVHEEIGLEVEPTGLIGVYSSPDYAFQYPNGDRVQPVLVLFDCRVTGGKLEPDRGEALRARYFGPDELPRMRPCCVAKARDVFAYEGEAFLR